VALRESGQQRGETFELATVTRDAEGDSGVRHGEYLLGLTEAVVGRDHLAVVGLAAKGVERLGDEGFVRAIAVAAGFDGINRVADAIGVPLDERFDALERTFWDETGIGRFQEPR
jgi:hypothetical protein